MRLYLDTSIWLDILEDRGENGRVAQALLRKAITEKWIIIFSDLHLEEMKHLGLLIRDIFDVMKTVHPNVRRVHLSRDQLLEGTRLGKERKVPKDDVRHAILARDNDAVLVSRDKDFNKLTDITEVRLPEDLV